jgi:5-methylcytosine-specific restriction enzyme A
MPMMPPRRCPTCRTFVTGPCPTCRRQYDRRRDQTAPWRAWYRREPWLSLRRTVLDEQPFCEVCEQAGLLVVSSCVDHRIPHKGNWQLFVARPNLRGLCATCNAVKANTSDRRPR